MCNCKECKILQEIIPFNEKYLPLPAKGHGKTQNTISMTNTAKHLMTLQKG